MYKINTAGTFLNVSFDGKIVKQENTIFYKIEMQVPDYKTDFSAIE